MQSIISDDQFSASSVSNLARLQNGQTRSKIGPNTGPIWQMMTTQPSAHQVVLHMVEEKWTKLFYSKWKSYNSLHFDKTSFLILGSWAKSGDAMQNGFKVHLRENSHRHISTNQASNWTGGQCGTHQEWGKLPGYFVIYNSGRLKRIIILFLEGSSSGPALLFVPMRYSIISRHIQFCE